MNQSQILIAEMSAADSGSAHTPAIPKLFAPITAKSFFRQAGATLTPQQRWGGGNPPHPIGTQMAQVVIALPECARQLFLATSYLTQ
jgi:hypothetical protein